MDFKKLLLSLEGRVSRKVFWLYFVAVLVISMVAGFVAASSINMEDPSQMAMPAWIWILNLLLLWPTIAVYAKRWHDQDRSGWWTLLILIPFIGPLIVLIMLGFIGGTPGPNRFGEGPMA